MVTPLNASLMFSHENDYPKNEFPEKYIRSVKWIDPKDAVSFIRNESLIQLLKNFDAKKSKASI